jgi:hypothetical protein
MKGRGGAGGSRAAAVAVAVAVAGRDPAGAVLLAGVSRAATGDREWGTGESE